MIADVTEAFSPWISDTTGNDRRHGDDVAAHRQRANGASFDQMAWRAMPADSRICVQLEGRRALLLVGAPTLHGASPSISVRTESRMAR